MNVLKNEEREKCFFNDYNDFMNQDKYISVKDVEKFFLVYKKLIKKIEHGIYYTNNYRKIKNIIDYVDDSVALHNHLFLARKLKENELYFKLLFKEIDKNISLDDEQKRAILTDEDYSMILAGAGSGKTTTIAAKVKYLVDKLHVKPEEIIVISFTNQAVNELKNRINKDFEIPAKICTFHKFGVEILRNNSSEHLKVLTSSYNVIKNYFEETLINNNQKLKEFIEFFAFYLNIPNNALNFSNLNDYINYNSKQNYKKIKRKLNSYNNDLINERKNDFITIKGESLKSAEEVMIANFLYLNNIEYDYEKPYPKLHKNSVYLPDFTIYANDKTYYIEHFGINSKGYNKRYDKSQNNKYKRAIIQKRKLHYYYETELIETYSEYKDGRTIIEHLKEELEKRNIILSPKPAKEVYDMLTNSCKDIYYSRFIIFCLNFIQKYKMIGYDSKYFKELKKRYKKDKRISYFLNLIEDIYNYYESYLVKNNYIDFEDMINKAYDLLKSKEKIKLAYKYIIIDEYQDISKQRFNLVKEISELSNSKIVAVGDDWQAIFAFSGSDVSLFTKFKKLMGYAKELKITHTYRNSQELIDVAGNFVMKNDFQLKKQLLSNKHLEKPIKLVPYRGHDIDKIKRINQCIKTIVKKYSDNKNILLIGRYSFDKQKILDKDYFIETSENKIKSINFPNVDITFLTAHSSKGLTFDNVIIINNENSVYGFPSQIKDDPIMNIINTNNDDFEYAEERRLFYVALTRTRNDVYLIYPEDKPSFFITEISKNKDVMTIKSKNKKIICPKCRKAYLVKTYNNYYNINMYTCGNAKELCNYKTNNITYKKEIEKCPKCDDGLLIVKENKKSGEYFMGCTNYEKKDCHFTKTL